MPINLAPRRSRSLVVYQTLNAMVTFKANPVLYVQLAIYLCLVSGLIQVSLS